MSLQYVPVLPLLGKISPTCYNTNLRLWNNVLRWHHMRLKPTVMLPEFKQTSLKQPIGGEAEVTTGRAWCRVFPASLQPRCCSRAQMDGSAVTLLLLINMTYPPARMQTVREATERWRHEGMINCGSVRLPLPLPTLPPPLWEMISPPLLSPVPPSLFISVLLTPHSRRLSLASLPLFFSQPPLSFSSDTLGQSPSPPAHLVTGRIITLVHHCPEKSNNLNLHLPHTPGLNYFIDM